MIPGKSPYCFPDRHPLFRPSFFAYRSGKISGADIYSLFILHYLFYILSWSLKNTPSISRNITPSIVSFATNLWKLLSINIISAITAAAIKTLKPIFPTVILLWLISLAFLLSYAKIVVKKSLLGRSFSFPQSNYFRPPLFHSSLHKIYYA